MKKRILSLTLTLCLLLGLLPGMALAAEEDSGVTVNNDLSAIFANGNAITLKAAAGDAGKTIIYKDGAAVELTGIEGTTISGYDLSKYAIYGGSKDAVVTGDTSITMESGTVRSIYGGGRATYAAEAKVNGNTAVTVSGGTVSDGIYGGGDASQLNASATISGTTTVTVSSGTVGRVFGGGFGGSGANVTVEGKTAVNISGGTVNDPRGGVYGGGCTDSVVGGAEVQITGGKVEGTVYAVTTYRTYGGNPLTPDATATVNISGGTVGGISDMNGSGSDTLQISGNATVGNDKNGINLSDPFKAVTIDSGFSGIAAFYAYDSDVTQSKIGTSIAAYASGSVDKLSLVGGGATGYELYLDGSDVKIRAKAVPHTHPICGTGCSHGGTHNAVEFQPLSQSDFDSAKNDPSTACNGVTYRTAGFYDLAGGNYYLSGNIEVEKEIQLPANQTVNLCLNGCEIKSASGRAFFVGKDKTLNFCDCKSGGKVIDTNGCCIIISTGGTANLFGGTFTFTAGTSSEVGCVKVLTDTSNLTVDGATLNSTESGKYALNVVEGTATVKSGTLSGGVTLTPDSAKSQTAALTVSGGSITGGQYSVFMASATGTLTLNGSPTISGTTADLRLSTGADTALNDTKVDATGYTGSALAVTEDSASEGAYAIKVSDGSKDKFTLNDSSGYQYVYKNGGLMIHKHSYGSEWKSDSANHWHECSCGAKTDAAAHSYDNDQDTACNTCGYTRTVGPLPSYSDPASGEGYSIDYTQEKITVNSGYEINTKSDGTGTTMGGGGAITPGTTLYIRKSGDATHQPSSWVVVTIPARPSAPAGLTAVSETTSGANDGKITGVSTSMEYSSDGGTTWTTCTGTEVTPLAPGGYQVRTKATGGAFAGTPVTVTVPAKTAPTHYTVVFDSRGGSDVSSQTVAVGGKAAKPTDPTRRGYTFGGWYTEPGCIHRWNFENAPTGDLILYAKWVENTYSISGTVTQGNQPVTNARVTLKQGGTTIATTTSDSQGKYSFTGVAPGSYNVVAEQNGKTMTILVPITNAHATEQNLTMPSENVNSVLEVKGEDTPEIVVGGLEQEAEQKKESGKTVTVTMTVESKDETAANANDIKAAASGKTLDFMEIKVEKKVDEGTAEAITTTHKLLTIIIPFDFTGKTNITVYRYHGSSVNTLATTADSNGEYIALGTESVTLYVKNFSTYAIGYEETATYAVTVQNDGHGTASASPASVAAGTEITLTAAPSSGYQFKEWQVLSGGVTIIGNKFTMPAGNVAVKAVFEYIGGGSSGGSTGGGSSTPSYPPVFEQPKHGTIKVSPSRPESGDKVTITVTPENGYETQAVTVTDRNGKSVKVTKNANGTYTFTQPSGKVTISASLKSTGSVSCADCPRDETCPIWPYTDASVTAWYHDGVHYCIDNGLMNGYGSGLFGPDKNLSRAMLAQILYNQAGRPAVSGIVFDDVAENAWYAQAVTWAAAQGIVSGYGDGRFGPDDNITREQLAVMLWRSSGSPAATNKELRFTDADQISGWALEALRWAVEQGLISGKGGGVLDPTGRATRAEAATMLQRYLENP